MSSKAIRKTFTAVSVCLAAGTICSTALADVSCVPSKIAFSTYGSSLRLDVQCNGTWYHAYSGECAATVDQIKAFLSLAQSSVLSGKLLEMNNGSTCGDSTRFDWMALVQ